MVEKFKKVVVNSKENIHNLNKILLGTYLTYLKDKDLFVKIVSPSQKHTSISSNPFLSFLFIKQNTLSIFILFVPYKVNVTIYWVCQQICFDGSVKLQQYRYRSLFLQLEIVTNRVIPVDALDSARRTHFTLGGRQLKLFALCGKSIN